MGHSGLEDYLPFTWAKGQRRGEGRGGVVVVVGERGKGVLFGGEIAR